MTLTVRVCAKTSCMCDHSDRIAVDGVLQPPLKTNTNRRFAKKSKKWETSQKSAAIYFFFFTVMKSKRWLKSYLYETNRCCLSWRKLIAGAQLKPGGNRRRDKDKVKVGGSNFWTGFVSEVVVLIGTNRAQPSPREESPCGHLAACHSPLPLKNGLQSHEPDPLLLCF